MENKMGGDAIFILGVLGLTVGTIFTYWGSNVKSEESSKRLTETIDSQTIEIDKQSLQIKDLVDGKNILISQNEGLKIQLSGYQIDLDENEKITKELQEKTELSARGITTSYDFNGIKRVTERPGHMNLITDGPEAKVYSKIVLLNDEKNFSALKEICSHQIKSTPRWLTPYLFLGVAFANLGEVKKAEEAFEYVVKHSAGDPAYAQAKQFLEQIANRISKN